jgi:beta-lactamase class A
VKIWPAAVLLSLAALLSSCKSPDSVRDSFHHYELRFDSRVDAGLQRQLEKIDSELRERFDMTTAQSAVGLLDLRTPRLAMIHPDRGEYAASIPKIGILLAWFDKHREPSALTPQVRHEFGLMIKASNNEIAAKYSRELGLQEIQKTLDAYGFYDAGHGGGIWVGKHYGESGERYGDPVDDNSHAATVRQLLRFFLLLEQGRLVSAEASRNMKEIFLSPEIPHDQIKFVKGLEGERVEIIRKWGSWENWLHDAAVIKCDDRYYILVALTHHSKGDEYLVELVRRVHTRMVDRD